MEENLQKEETVSERVDRIRMTYLSFLKSVIYQLENGTESEKNEVFDYLFRDLVTIAHYLSSINNVETLERVAGLMSRIMELIKDHPRNIGGLLDYESPYRMICNRIAQLSPRKSLLKKYREG